MTIESSREQPGVTVHLDPQECELFVRLAADAERVNRGDAGADAVSLEAPGTYLSLSLMLGRKIQELAGQEPSVLGRGAGERPLARTMIDLVLGPDLGFG